MHGIGFELPLQDWFDFKILKTSIKKDYIQNCLESEENFIIKTSAKIIWLGNAPLTSSYIKSKKGLSKLMSTLVFHDKTTQYELKMEQETAVWLVNMLERISIYKNEFMNFADLKLDFENHFDDFELFWYSKPIDKLRANGLLIL